MSKEDFKEFINDYEGELTIKKQTAIHKNKVVAKVETTV